MPVQCSCLFGTDDPNIQCTEVGVVQKAVFGVLKKGIMIFLEL